MPPYPERRDECRSGMVGKPQRQQDQQDGVAHQGLPDKRLMMTCCSSSISAFAAAN